MAPRKPTTRQRRSSITTRNSNSTVNNNPTISFGEVIVPLTHVSEPPAVPNNNGVNLTDTESTHDDGTDTVNSHEDEGLNDDIDMSNVGENDTDESSLSSEEQIDSMEEVESSNTNGSSSSIGHDNHQNNHVRTLYRYNNDSFKALGNTIAGYTSRVAELMVNLTTLNAANPNSNEANTLRSQFNQESKDLQNMVDTLTSMKSAKDIWVGARDKVPKDLPKLQWIGSVFDKQSVVFNDANDALRKYRDIIIMSDLDPDAHWRRLLPAVLSQELSDRLEDIPDNIRTWKEFHVYFLNTVGVDNDEEKQQAYSELLEIKMGRYESLQKYLDRFFSLKKRSNTKDGLIITDRFVKGLEPRLRSKVSPVIDGWSKKKRSSFRVVMSYIKKTSSKMHKDGQESEDTNNRGVKAWKQFSKNQDNKDDNNKRRERLQMLKRKGLCFTCEKDFIPGKHVCDKKDNKGKLSFNSCRRNESKYMNNKIDNLLLESNLPLSKDNVSDIVPITLDGNQIYAFVDNGANFSSIHPRIFKLFNKNKFVKSNNDGTVSLAYKQADEVDRVGQITSVDILYNGISTKHDFELFDFDSDASAVIGRDLMPKLNICMTGLATSWLPYEPVDEDPIDASALDEDNTGNNYDAGTKEEREQMMYELQPLLDVNAKIPITSCCTLPGAEVELHIDESKYQFRRQYPIPYAYQQPVNDQVQTWLKDGVIAEADDDDAKCYQSPLLAVRKKDLNGEYGKKIRVVLDIRSINEVLIPSSICKFQLPLISDLHQRMSGKQLFSVLDLTQCYHRFPMHKNSQKYAVFYHEGKQYKFIRAPFGISSVGAIVQRAISHLIADLPYAQVYIDDLQIATHNDMQYHTDCLKEVISRLNKVGLILNNGKAHYAQTQVNALGYTISVTGLSLDKKKVANVHEWPVPTTGKAVQRLLGFSGYLRTVIPLYSRITQPLDELRNLGSLAKVWNESHMRAFNLLKEVLTCTPVIAPANFEEEFYVGTDASAHCIGGICYQIINGVVKYIAFASRVLSKSERNYSTTRRELVAVLFCFSKFRHWLLHAKFHLITDHRCLLYLHTQQTPNNLMLAYYESIFSLDYDVTHTAGIFHILPDRISRLFDIYDDENEAEPLDDDIVRLDSEERSSKRRKKNMKDNENKKGGNDVKKLHDDHFGKNKFDRNDPDINLFFRSAHINESDTKKLSKQEKEDLIVKYHVLGHYGINQVEKQMRLDNVSWPKMRKDITKVLAHCSQCQNFNTVTRKGYHPPRSENPNGPGQIWSMDLGDFHITSASGKNFILIIVDLFSRYVVLRALPNKEATTIAQELVDVMAILGVPRAICSDNDMNNQAISKIFEHLHIDHRLSNPYNPTGNAIAEAFVKQTKLYLMKRFYGADDQWDKYLNACMIGLNMKYSRLHNTRPFTAQFFRAPNMFGDINQVEPFSSKSINPALIEAKIREVQDMIIPALRQKIEERQLKDHDYAMKRKRIIYEPYPIGTRVMVEVPTRDAKSIRRYEGPYRVMSVTKGGSYNVASIASGALLSRPVSISQLKYVDSDDVKPRDNDDTCFDVLAVVDHDGDDPENRLYRVKWKGFPEDEEDTWEPIENFESVAPIRKYLKRKGLIDNSKLYREKQTTEKYKNKEKQRKEKAAAKGSKDKVTISNTKGNIAQSNNKKAASNSVGQNKVVPFNKSRKRTRSGRERS